MRQILGAGESITAVMSGAAATANPTVFVDSQEGPNESVTPVALSGVTAVTLATTNSQRTVKSISICNVDTAAVTVTLKRVIGSSSYVICAATLAVGDILVVDSDGIRSTDSSGHLLNSSTVTTIVTSGIDLASGRIWDATTNTALGATPASADDFGITAGTFLTSDPSLRSSDAKATTVTSKARFAYTVPTGYVAGQPITLRANAGMVTTISDGTATIDAQVVRRGAPTVDICATNATTINTLAGGNVDFTLTPTNVVPGDVLDIVMTSAVTDSETGTAVIAELRALSVRTTVRA